jgi:dTMP kinase
MYLALEGIDGVGKTTQLGHLKHAFPDAVITKEPGATELGSRIRELVLGENDYAAKSELFLFMADRAEHTQKVVIPALDSGKSVISDRSLISGIAYTDTGFDMEYLGELNRFAVDNVLPDKAVILTIDEEGYLERIRGRNEKEDNIEKRGLAYMMQTQERFIRAAEILGIEFLQLDAKQSEMEIFEMIKEFVNG